MNMLVRFIPYHILPYRPVFLEDMGIAMCVCIAIGAIILITRFIEHIIAEKRLGHNYQLDNVIYVLHDGKPYDSTYNFICTKCGKLKTVDVRGLDNWMSTHMSDNETLKENIKE